mgnify:CR=1 FL=1
MKVILLKDVKKQGKSGEIINVKDGYGTYLINNKLAVLETKGSKKVLDEQNKAAQAEASKILKECQEFKVKTGKNDQVFGTISTKQIADELKKKGIDVDKRKIRLDVPVNTLGVTEVSVLLHKEVEAKLKIRLVK